MCLVKATQIQGPVKGWKIVDALDGGPIFKEPRAAWKAKEAPLSPVELYDGRLMDGISAFENLHIAQYALRCLYVKETNCLAVVSKQLKIRGIVLGGDCYRGIHNCKESLWNIEIDSWLHPKIQLNCVVGSTCLGWFDEPDYRF